MAAAPTPNIQRQFTYHRSLTAIFLQILKKIETVTAAWSFAYGVFGFVLDKVDTYIKSHKVRENVTKLYTSRIKFP